MTPNRVETVKEEVIAKVAALPNLTDEQRE
jgi:hypothetical protein